MPIVTVILQLSGFMAYNLYLGAKGIEPYKSIAMQLE